MKITVIGAGRTYTPELISGFISDELFFSQLELFLTDIDSERLEILANLTERMIKSSGVNIRLTVTSDLDKALSDSDFVITQIRVGKMPARLIDEEIPFELGLIAQETTGAGGFSCALRTIPVILDIAKKMEKLCPKAWLINFTNPSGIVTQALVNHSRIKSLGLCNVPITLIQKIADILNADRTELSVDYFGLNHFSFIRDVFYKNTSVFDRVYLDVSDEVFDKDLIRNLKLIPSYYLNYFFYSDREIGRASCRERV